MEALIADVKALLAKAVPLIGDFSGAVVTGDDVENALMFLTDANETILDEAKEGKREIGALWKRLGEMKEAT